jgi:hypothetical protein
MIRAIAIVGALLVAGDAFGEGQAVRIGLYSSVTESEWAIELDLRQDQMAVVEVASWDPGERDKAKVKRYTGTWQAKGSTIEVQTKRGTAAWRYDPALSFADFGREGHAPGLVVVSATGQLKVLSSQSLWLKSELMHVKW